MLVVDDVPEILDLFRGIVRRIRAVPVVLEVAPSGERAVARLRERTFDLVVSDFRMRQVDGIEVLQKARELHPEGRRILMTGYNEVPAAPERIRAAGVDAYVHKPLRSQETLLLLTDFLVGNEEAIRQAREQARALEAST